VDSSGEPVANAQLDVFTQELELTVQLITDDSGAFFAELPPGDYLIVTNSSQGRKTVSARVLQEGSGPIRIILEAELQPNMEGGVDVYGWALVLFVMFFILAALVGGFRLVQAAFKKDLKPHGHVALAKHRADEILPTLNEREKEVVNYLLEHGDKKRFSKVRFETKIPKTSFFRVIDSLEKRKIIRVERFLNTAELFLTDWFKGKE